MTNPIFKEINQFLNPQNELNNNNFQIESNNKSNIILKYFYDNLNLFSLENLFTEFEIYIFPSKYFIIIILPAAEKCQNQVFLFYKENFQIKQKLIGEYNNLKDKLLHFRKAFNKYTLPYCEYEDYNKILCEIFKINHNNNKRKKKRMKFRVKFLYIDNYF